MHPEGREVQPAEAVTTKIFLTRLRLLSFFQFAHDEKNLEKTKSKLQSDIGKLPQESIAVQEHLRDVELAASPSLWTRVDLKPTDFLKSKISPLMRYMQNVEPNAASFTQKCEELSLAILTNSQAEIERLKDAIAEMLGCLPLTITEVKAKEIELRRVLDRAFWQNPTYGDVQNLLEEFAPLMKYKRSEPIPPIVPCSQNVN